MHYFRRREATRGSCPRKYCSKDVILHRFLLSIAGSGSTGKVLARSLRFIVDVEHLIIRATSWINKTGGRSFLASMRLAPHCEPEVRCALAFVSLSVRERSRRAGEVAPLARRGATSRAVRRRSSASAG